MTSSQKDKRIKVLIATVGTYKEKLTRERNYTKALNQQYERVVREYQKQIKEIKANIPKQFVLSLIRKVRRK